MKISTRGEYGIRALLYLAMHQGDGPVPSHQIAAHQAIPEAYLRQILAALARGGLVSSNRGPLGGHNLARSAHRISLLDVILCLEGQTTSVEDILALPCGIGLGPQHCAIREVLLAVKRQVDAMLANATLADLARRQRHILEQGETVPRAAAAAALPVWEP